MSASDAAPASDPTCILCGGSGRMRDQDRHSRARKGGNASYMRSLQSGELSMKDRGRMGGRPKRRTLADLAARGDAAEERSSRT